MTHDELETLVIRLQNELCSAQQEIAFQRKALGRLADGTRAAVVTVLRNFADVGLADAATLAEDFRQGTSERRAQAFKDWQDLLIAVCGDAPVIREWAEAGQVAADFIAGISTRVPTNFIDPVDVMLFEQITAGLVKRPPPSRPRLAVVSTQQKDA